MLGPDFENFGEGREGELVRLRLYPDPVVLLPLTHEMLVDAGIELTHQHIIADSPNRSGIVYSGIL